MRYNNLMFSILVLCNSYLSITASIECITSFSQAQAVLDQADHETLVVFDVDDTLIRPVDKLLQKEYSRLYTWKSIEKELRQFVQEDEELWSIIYGQCQRELIEPSVAQLIITLQARGVKVLACTLWRVGPYGTISSLEELRFKQLKELAIDFTSSFTTTQIFDQCKQHHGHKPLLYKGILFTNLCPKGEVLGAFLDSLDWRPKKVIFFDDQPQNLLSVQEILSQQDIEFYGYYYKMPSGQESIFNPTVAQFQVNYFVTHTIWISEREAQALLTL